MDELVRAAQCNPGATDGLSYRGNQIPWRRGVWLSDGVTSTPRRRHRMAALRQTALLRRGAHRRDEGFGQLGVPPDRACIGDGVPTRSWLAQLAHPAEKTARERVVLQLVGRAHCLQSRRRSRKQRELLPTRYQLLAALWDGFELSASQEPGTRIGVALGATTEWWKLDARLAWSH